MFAKNIVRTLGESTLMCVLAGAGCARFVPPAEATQYTVVEMGDEQMLYGSHGLERAAYDFDHDGRVDAILYYDRRRARVRGEFDLAGGGRLTRWEYYDARGRVVKVGASRRNSGRPDEWTLADEQGHLVSRELDQDGDGRPDRWEHYRNGALITVTGTGSVPPAR